MELLEKDNERLQHLIRWTDCEDVFWKWMVCSNTLFGEIVL